MPLAKDTHDFKDWSANLEVMLDDGTLALVISRLCKFFIENVIIINMIIENMITANLKNKIIRSFSLNNKFFLYLCN